MNSSSLHKRAVSQIVSLKQYSGARLILLQLKAGGIRMVAELRFFFGLVCFVFLTVLGSVAA